MHFCLSDQHLPNPLILRTKKNSLLQIARAYVQFNYEVDNEYLNPFQERAFHLSSSSSIPEDLSGSWGFKGHQSGRCRALFKDQAGFVLCSVRFVLRAAAEVVIHLRQKKDGCM